MSQHMLGLLEILNLELVLVQICLSLLQLVNHLLLLLLQQFDLFLFLFLLEFE